MAPRTTWIRTRFVLCVMIFLGHFNLYTLRNMLNVAIVAMTDIGVIPDEIWNLPSSEVILASFYPLYIITNLLAGPLASRFGGKQVCGLGVAFTAVATFFVPLAARTSYVWLMVVRVIQGIFEGFVLGSFHTLFGKWFPRNERAVLKAVCSSGMATAFLVGNPITGYLCASNFLGGWPAVFYFFGLIAVVWFIVWCLIIFECPADHPWISDDELKYILDSQGEEHAQTVIKTPWRSILSSSAVWSLVMYDILSGFYDEFMKLVYPTYLKQAYNFDITQIGWLTSVPHVLQMAISFSGAGLADFIVSRNHLKRRTLIRKIFFTIANVPLIFCLIGVALLKDNPYAVVGLITTGSAIGSINSGGSSVGSVEISPVFSGSVYGLCNGLENIVPLVAPLIIAAITAGKQTSREAWNTVFYIALALHCAAIIVYLVFGSADLQSWGLGLPHSPQPSRKSRKVKEDSHLKSNNPVRLTPKPGNYRSINSNAVGAD